jgi:hypothetical protein
LIDLDETGFAPSTTHPQHGWAAKAQRVRGLQSAQQRPRTSLMGA